MRQDSIDFLTEVIATWRRDSDGLQIHLRRDGRSYFLTAKNRRCLALLDSSIDQITKWTETNGRGFYRIDKGA